MPQRRCAKKRLRADKKRHLRNNKIKLDFRKTIKSFVNLITEKKANEAKAELNKIIAKIDKAVTKGYLHKNTAARKKSAFTKKVNALLAK